MAQNWMGIAWGIVALVSTAYAEPKRFLGIDESRGQLIYVDLAEATNNWVLKLPVKCRDYQLIGNHRLLLSGNNGYYEYDLRTRECVKKFSDPAYGRTMSARRTRDGRTFLGCLQQDATVVYELDPNDVVLRKAMFNGRKTLRLLRLTKDETFFFGGPADTLVEGDMTGAIRRKIPVSGGKHVYQGLQLESGNVLVSSGYGAAVVEFDPAGKEVRRFAVSPEDKARGVKTLFFAGMQCLPDGSVVVSNWTGHGQDDSKKGPQLLMFDKDGRLVWSWHDSTLAGTLHGVIVLDNLDPMKFADDCLGILRQ